MLNLWESLQTPLNFVEFLVLEIVPCSWWISVLILTAKREKVGNVFVMWLVIVKVLTPRALYRLTCGLWANELVPCGLGTACVAFWTELASFWPWGPICKYVKYGTTSQIKKMGLFLKEIKKFDCFLKELGQICKKTKYLDWTAIFKSIWTKM